jgi:hypothetical protein
LFKVWILYMINIAPFIRLIKSGFDFAQPT